MIEDAQNLNSQENRSQPSIRLQGLKSLVSEMTRELARSEGDIPLRSGWVSE